MNNYKISVITPFHNVEKGMFEAACKSMLQQTIGFENVQWIIVAHNCEQPYIDYLQDMVGKYDNVTVSVLNNDVKSPSSPRNHGMKLATAPYMGFLDGDDSYTVNCLEEAVKALEETHSQIAWFRREFSMEDNSLYPMAEILLWNQVEPRIIVEQGHWEQEKMFTGLWAFVTSKIFDRQFLIDNNLTFDENVSYGEDAIFVTHAFAKAPRMCVMPQLIGYHYYINSASLIQKMDKSPQTIINYAKGFEQSLMLMDGYGMYKRYSTLVYLAHILRFILTTPGVTTEHRRIVKEALGRYITLHELPPVSKIVPKDFADEIYKMSERVILNPESDITDYQREIQSGLPMLIKMLSDNMDTDYGQEYHFEDVWNVADYQRLVPLTEYKDYERLIRLQTNSGESGILTQSKAERYAAKLSGKMLPLTSAHIAPYNVANAQVMKGYHNLWLAQSIALSRRTNDLAYVDNLRSMLVKDYFCNSYYAFGVKQATFATPMSMFFSENDTFDDYAFMCKGIADKEVDQIVGMTTGDVLKAFEVLEKHWLEMVAEISLTDKARAEELKGIFAEGFEGIAGRIWPNLKRVMAYGAGKQSEATEQLRGYIKGTALNHGYFLTAESLIAQATGDDEDTFRLITDNDFFEFIPDDDITGKEALPLSMVEIGEKYRLVVTNHAGLYRFKTSHCVTFVKNNLGEYPIIKILE